MNILIRTAAYCLLPFVLLRNWLIDKYVLPRYQVKLEKLQSLGYIMAAPPSDDAIRLALGMKVTEAFSRVLWIPRDFEGEDEYPVEDMFVVNIVYPFVDDSGFWTLMVEVSNKATGAEAGSFPLSMFLTGFIPQEEIELTQYNS